MSNRNYILNSKGEPMPEPDLMKWAAWFQVSERSVGDTTVGESRISTVFLGLDHSYSGGAPVLWETMVFGGPMGGDQNRCSGSREQAEAMHERMVQHVKGSSKA